MNGPNRLICAFTGLIESEESPVRFPANASPAATIATRDDFTNPNRINGLTAQPLIVSGINLAIVLCSCADIAGLPLAVLH